MEQILLTNNVKLCIIILYIVLFLITLYAYIMSKVKENSSNLFTRMKSFWIIVILFTIAFMFNKLTAVFFIMLISYLALKEFFSMIPTRRSDRRVLLWAYLSIPIQFYFIYTNWIVMFYLFIPLYLFILIPLRMVMVGDTEGFLKSCGIIHWALMTCVYAIGYFAVYFSIPNEINPQGGALGLLLFILIITISNDFMQYVFGKSMGKNKITPNVSPNKTWEGFIGGAISTAVLSMLIAPILTPLSIIQAGIVGLIIAIAGFFGDITMSAIKRDIGVKDTGALLPGHGGILDRLDSMIFTVPLFFHYIAYTNNIGILH
ncbi:TPA: phosphatidate cytidylyltransferase [Candidatus Avigastranaerophilus faecigallinarum]|nr:phosphatidate cytidylyltransferase [Candidatus Avigastranaerophilus faecigallinarum]